MKKYLVFCFHTISEDNYEKGEMEKNDFWHDETKINAENPLEAIRCYYLQNLKWELDLNVVEQMDDIIFDSRLVDKNNCIADEYEKELWKVNKLPLFRHDVQIHVEEIIFVPIKNIF